MMSLHVVMWIFVLGWLAARSKTVPQLVLTATLIVALVPGSFHEPLRELVITPGLLLLLVPRIPVPRLAVAPLGAVAAASLAIYLTHYAVYPDLLAGFPAGFVLASCIGVGILAHRATGLAHRGLKLMLTQGRVRNRTSSINR